MKAPNEILKRTNQNLCNVISNQSNGNMPNLYTINNP